VNRQVRSPALLVRSVPYGESDLIATFFTKDAGLLGAIVRGGRRSQRRFGGALEPIHTLDITLDDRGKELCLLKEARIAEARLGITGSLDAMDAAGHALRWTRHLCPPRTPEPAAWRSLTELFDRLDRADEPRPHLAFFGLHMLTDMGYALELERCVKCGRACPPMRSAFFDGARGGLVCMSCGGARRTMTASLRALALAAQRGEHVALNRDDARELIDIVEEAMAAHAGFEPL
jgi:DNA repair protein RecO (recombination protein O)